MNELRLAFGLLTTLPVRLPKVTRSSAGWAMTLAPLTTAPLLVMVALAHWSVRHAWLSPLLAALLVVAAGNALTRGLHLDGLADTADGFATPRDPLAAMKASDVGPAGVVALVLVLLGQVAALELLLPWDSLTLAAGAAVLTSRVVLAWGCCSVVPAASPDGLGVMVAGTVPVWRAALGSLVVLALSAVAGWPGVVAVVVGLAAGLVLLLRARHRFGGITGDVLGALVEVGLLAGLVGAVLAV